MSSCQEWLCVVLRKAQHPIGQRKKGGPAKQSGSGGNPTNPTNESDGTDQTDRVAKPNSTTAANYVFLSISVVVGSCVLCAGARVSHVSEVSSQRGARKVTKTGQGLVGRRRRQRRRGHVGVVRASQFDDRGILFTQNQGIIQWGNEKPLDSIPSPFPSPLTTNPTLDRYRCYPHIHKRARLLKKGNFYAQEQNRKMRFASPLPPPTTQTQTPAHSPAPWPASPSSSPCSGTRAEAACQSTYKTLAGAHWVPSPPRAAAPQT